MPKEGVTARVFCAGLRPTPKRHTECAKGLSYAARRRGVAGRQTLQEDDQAVDKDKSEWIGIPNPDAVCLNPLTKLQGDPWHSQSFPQGG
jgi:hypothetical protein